jgi:hypothetical protein
MYLFAIPNANCDRLETAPLERGRAENLMPWCSRQEIPHCSSKRA